MNILFPPEVEARLNHLATESGRGTEQLVVEWVTSHLEHDEWFRHEVKKGLDSLDRGEFLTQEQVGERLEQMLKG